MRSLTTQFFAETDFPMKIHPLLSRRLSAGAAALALLGCGVAAHALPDAKWDNPADDRDIINPGLSLADAIMNDKRAPNGTTRDPLSQGYADYLMTAFEWVFQLQMTPAQRAEFTRRLSDDWMNGAHPSGAPGAFAIAEFRAPIDEFMPKDQITPWHRALARQKQLPILQNLAVTDAKNGPWLLSLYNQYHPALAPGEPRLTDLTTNALTEQLVFMINQVIGKPAAKVTPDLQKRVAKDLIALWPKLTPARRAQYLKMEPDFYYLRQDGWKYVTEATREQTRIAWGTELQNAFPAVKPMVLKRKAALEAAKRKEAARWAKMSPAQQQMALMQMQNQMQMNQTMMASMQRMQLQNHATNMNIIENMRPNPQYYYSVK